jgi:hypothetical protein
MARLLTQSEAQIVRDLPFCYLCGKSFADGDETNYDHVPPAAVFDKTDHDFPIKLKVHEHSCHAPLNLDDEIIGQLISLKHGRYPSEAVDKLKIESYRRTDNDALMHSFTQQDLKPIIRRWIKGFHAALYKAPLPAETKFAIQTPRGAGRQVHEIGDEAITK